MGASASSPGVARIPPGQRRGLQAVCGTQTHGPARGVHKRAAWGAETCAAKPVWFRTAAPAVARRRGRLLRRPSPGIIRSQVNFQPGAESKPLPSLLAMVFSGFSVSLKVTSQCGAELRKGGLRAAGVSEKQSYGDAQGTPVPPTVPGKAAGRQEAARNSATSPLPMVT